MTLGSHQATIGKSQVHLTPRWIIDRLGPFDLDPCAALPRPWDCATHNISEAEDGLAHEWRGRVWLNPPFDRRQVGRWMARLANHGRELTDADHGTLLEALRTLKGMVVLSGYPSPLYDQHLNGWLRVERAALADGARERTEVLWINPACAAALERERMYAGHGLFSALEAAE